MKNGSHTYRKHLTKPRAVSRESVNCSLRWSWSLNQDFNYSTCHTRLKGGRGKLWVKTRSTFSRLSWDLPTDDAAGGADRAPVFGRAGIDDDDGGGVLAIFSAVCLSVASCELTTLATVPTEWDHGLNGRVGNDNDGAALTKSSAVCLSVASCELTTLAAVPTKWSHGLNGSQDRK